MLLALTAWGLYGWFVVMGQFGFAWWQSLIGLVVSVPVLHACQCLLTQEPFGGHRDGDTPTA